MFRRFELLDDDGLTGLLVDIEARQRRLDAERAAVLAEWDRRQAWANDGSATAAARLARDTGVARSVARERVQVTEKLSSMPHTQAALEALGWPKVRLLANVINDRTAEAFGESEEKLVAAALELSVDQLGTVLLHWRRLVDEDGANADADSMHAGEYLKISESDAVRLACDAAVARVLSKNGSVPLDLGRTVRDPSEYQRRAMSVLWATCGYTGCDRPFAWCQLHHVWHWEKGGPTDIGWLIPLCSRHHHQHHKGRLRHHPKTPRRPLRAQSRRRHPHRHGQPDDQPAPPPHPHPRLRLRGLTHRVPGCPGEGWPLRGTRYPHRSHVRVAELADAHG